MRLNGKSAIITGALGNMGSEEVRLFLAEGANVLAVDVHDEAIKPLVAEGSTMPDNLRVMRADITKRDDWVKIVDTAVEVFGTIDILVNNAGVSSGMSPDIYDEDGWDTIVNVNMKGPFLGMKHVIPKMLESGGGSIVNVSSVASLVGLKNGHLAYGPSKAGVASLSRTVASRFGAQGIRSNAVYPGTMDVGQRTRDPKSSARSDAILLQTPLGRRGTAADIAQGVLFLASDEASYISGADLVIDGGFIAQ